MKKLLMVGVLLVLGVIAVLWFYGSGGGAYPQPKVLDSNDKGMLLSLPVVAMQRDVTWQPEWVSASEPGRQAVRQALAGLAEALAGAPVALTVNADRGLGNREKFAQRVGEALSEAGLGRYQLRDADPEEPKKVGVILYASIKDTAVAKKILGALSPYLGGRVAFMYRQQADGEMTLELHGAPFFNAQGQATFDPNLINLAD